MTREQLEALWGQITGDSSDQKFVQMVVDTLKGKAHWVFQAVFNQGHAAATAENRSTIERLESELETANKAVEKERKAKEKAQEANPDVAKVRQELETQIAELNNQLTEERNGRKQDRIDSATRRAEADLIAVLSTRIDPVLARAHVTDPANKGRIKVTLNEDGTETVQVLQKGLSIPVQHEKPLEALAEEIVAVVPEKYHVSNADRGAGTRGNGGGGSPTSVFEKIRQETQQRQKQDQERAGALAGAERLGVVRR